MYFYLSTFDTESSNRQLSPLAPPSDIIVSTTGEKTTESILFSSVTF